MDKQWKEKWISYEVDKHFFFLQWYIRIPGHCLLSCSFKPLSYLTWTYLIRTSIIFFAVDTLLLHIHVTVISSNNFYFLFKGRCQCYFHTIDLAFVSDHPISKYRLRPQIIKKIEFEFSEWAKSRLALLRRGTHRIIELRQFWHLTSAKFSLPL